MKDGEREGTREYTGIIDEQKGTVVTGLWSPRGCYVNGLLQKLGIMSTNSGTKQSD